MSDKYSSPPFQFQGRINASATLPALSDPMHANSMERISILMEKIHVAYANTDDYLAIMEANKEFGRIFQTYPSRYKGKHLCKIVKSPALHTVVEEMLNNSRKTKTRTCDFSITPRTGARNSLQLTASCRRLESGGFMFFFQDKKTVNDWDSMLYTICSTLHYELNKPASFINSLTEVLGDTPIADIYSMLDVKMACCRIQHVLKVLHQYSEIVKLKTIETTQCSLCNAIAAAKKRVAECFPTTDMELVLEIPEEYDSVRADPALLTDALFHLLHNAAKFARSQCRAYIQATKEAEHTHIVITDNGRGIDPTVMECIFEPFYQEPDVAAEYGGLGLGLPLTKRIIELHGGNIACSSTLNQCASFHISLPLAPAC